MALSFARSPSPIPPRMPSPQPFFTPLPCPPTHPRRQPSPGTRPKSGHARKGSRSALPLTLSGLHQENVCGEYNEKTQIWVEDSGTTREEEWGRRARSGERQKKRPPPPNLSPLWTSLPPQNSPSESSSGSHSISSSTTNSPSRRRSPLPKYPVRETPPPVPPLPTSAFGDEKKCTTPRVLHRRKGLNASGEVRSLDLAQASKSDSPLDSALTEPLVTRPQEHKGYELFSNSKRAITRYLSMRHFCSLPDIKGGSASQDTGRKLRSQR